MNDLTPFAGADLGAVILRLQAGYIRGADPRQVFEALLPEVLQLTRSQHGFIADVLRDSQGAPYLKIVALSENAWADAARTLHMLEDGIELRNLDTLFGAPVGTGRPVIANDVRLRAAELPPGHPVVQSFLGVPLHHGGELVGVVGLANRPGGYGETLLQRLQPLWSTVGAIIGQLQTEREHRRAEEARRRSEERLRRLTDSVEGAFFLVRVHAGGSVQLLYASQGLARLLRLPAGAEVPPLDVMLGYIDPRDRPHLRSLAERAWRDLQPIRMAYRVYLPDGMRWHELQALAERDRDGSVLLHGFAFDVTHRKEYEQALVAAQAADRANVAKSEFLSRMSHELRTPLNAVLGFAQLLQLDDEPLTEQQRTRLAHIERAGAHLLEMINDVLDLSRIEAGTMPLAPEALPVATLVDDAQALVAAQAGAAGVTLLPASVPRDLHVRGDRVRLRQVLVNLLTNAIKYNRPAGSVHVKAREEGGEVALSVIDTGIGLSPAQLEHLWEPFNRLGAERTPVEGTGIGLALSRRMVEMMQGRMEAHSEVGRGSAFTVRLPAATRVPPPSPQAAAGRRGPVRRAAPVRTVLYAEDSAINVELVKQVFQLHPHLRLLVARNGAEALRLAREAAPDLLLLDIHLGDMTGMDVLATLAGEGIRPPAVALSADVQPARMRQAREAGFVDYVAKPLDVAELVRCIDRVLRA